MTTSKKPELLTADELLRLYSEGVKWELIREVLCETVAAGVEHGQIAVNVASELLSFVRPRRLGTVVASDTGFWLERDPDTVREPDVALISAKRLPLDARVRGYGEFPPDLVVEIVSPSDTLPAVNDKAVMWLSFGVALAWVVNPETRTVDVHQAGSPVVTLYEDGTLEGGGVLPGFALPVKEIFE